jgi:hypothetical protein
MKKEKNIPHEIYTKDSVFYITYSAIDEQWENKAELEAIDDIFHN